MTLRKRKALDLVKSVNKRLINENAINPNQSLLLAVSGGQDSICLLLLVSQLKGQWGWKVTVLHCNHLWVEDSLIAHSFVFKTAFLFGIPALTGFTLRQVSTEQRARDWRLATFQHINLFYNFNRALTGHSSSDRLETGLFNLFRGSGLKGVSASSWRVSKTFKWFSRPRDCFFKGGGLPQIGLTRTCCLVTFTRHRRLGGCPVLFAWLVGFGSRLRLLCRAQPALGQSKMPIRAEAKGFFRALKPLDLTISVQSKTTVKRDYSKANHLLSQPGKQVGSRPKFCNTTKCSCLTVKGRLTKCSNGDPGCCAEVGGIYKCRFPKGFSFCSRPHFNGLKLRAKVLFACPDHRG